MSIITIDAVKCTSCGQCVEECPSFILTIEKDIPVITNEKACISCGHCVAVCPEGAFEHDLAPLKNMPELNQSLAISSQQAEQFLRARRSVRKYQSKQIPRELLIQLLNVARLAPSGGNSQNISYLVIDDNSVLKEVSAATRNWICGDNAGSRRMRFYKVFIEKFMKLDIDVILRDAPALIVALAPKQLEPGFSNARFALAYAELYATSLNLGSCWAGFFEMCGQAGYQPMYDLLGIPEDKVICGGIMIGYPLYQFHRLVDRNPLDIRFI